MNKIAHQIAQQHTNASEASDVAASRAIAKDQIWSGDGYTKYTFDDNSVLIHTGGEVYAMDSDDADSIRGYAKWLDTEAADAEAGEVDRLLEALEA